MSLDAEGIEDLVLQRRRSVDELDVTPRVQLVQSDGPELGQRAAWRDLAKLMLKR